MKCNGELFDDELTHQTTLADKFGAPPFSVIDTRKSDFRNRAKAWRNTGIKSELGRDNRGNYSELVKRNPKNMVSAKLVEYSKKTGGGPSVFNPALTELFYSWFCPVGGLILDPFAGGSVRGIVAAKKGYRYWGSELRPEQVESNRHQAKSMSIGNECQWIVGDSVVTLDDAPESSMVFSCPPYHDLEVYSDDERDLSNMGWHAFCFKYRRIIKKSCSSLANDSFAVFVVGEIRDRKTRMLKGLVPETIRAFGEAGLGFFNDIILLMAIGTQRLVAGPHFERSRLVSRVHQNALVFCKGDPKKAAEKVKNSLRANSGVTQ